MYVCIYIISLWQAISSERGSERGSKKGSKKDPQPNLALRLVISKKIYIQLSSTTRNLFGIDSRNSQDSRYRIWWNSSTKLPTSWCYLYFLRTLGLAFQTLHHFKLELCWSLPISLRAVFHKTTGRNLVREQWRTT